MRGERCNKYYCGPVQSPVVHVSLEQEANLPSLGHSPKKGSAMRALAFAAFIASARSSPCDERGATTLQAAVHPSPRDGYIPATGDVTPQRRVHQPRHGHRHDHEQRQPDRGASDLHRFPPLELESARDTVAPRATGPSSNWVAVLAG